MSDKADTPPTKRTQADKAELTFGLRLKSALGSRDMTWLSRETGISTSTLSDYSRGKLPRVDKAMQIATAVGRSVEYLMGVGELDEPPPDRESKLRGFQRVDASDLVELAEIDLRYGLGATYLDGPVVTNMRSFSRDWFRHITRDAPDAMFWAVGDGESMEPTIRSGELILIDGSQKTPRMGEGIWALALGEIGMIKRIHFGSGGSVQLLSDNQLIPPIAVGEDELHVVGRVVAVVRRL